MPKTPATDPAGTFWPTESYLEGCSANTVAIIAIAQGAADADYPEDGSDRTPEDKAFWDRVRREADRIASWAVDGLAIKGKAVPGSGAAQK